MAPNRKFYVVWEGHAPGIYDSWEECKLQVEGFPGAKYRAYPDLDSATKAFRGDPAASMLLFRNMASHLTASAVNYSAFPEIRLDAIAVDAACAHNPGPVEYRGVQVGTGQQIFHVGPLPAGTNNIGEYLAIIHAAALLKKQGDTTTPIYSDSRTALSWLRKGHSNSTLTPTHANESIRQLLRRADAWYAANGPIVNPVIKWDTDAWGEIPADFGRK